MAVAQEELIIYDLKTNGQWWHHFINFIMEYISFHIFCLKQWWT